MLNNLEVRLVGTSPLMVNNPITVNKLAGPTKAIAELAGKRTRTDAEETELLRLKWLAALYWTDELGPSFPAYNVMKSAQEAARLSKQGKMWERGVIAHETWLSIDYDGPRDKDAMWDFEGSRFVDIRDAKVGSASRVLACRPVFPAGWTMDIGLDIAVDVANPETILQNIVSAGRLIGVGTFRARFGRFKVELIDTNADLIDACDRLSVPVVAKQRR